MWREMARIMLVKYDPDYVFVENSPMLTSRGLGTSPRRLGLKLGFDARWGVLGGDNSKLPHRRKRIWLLATNHDCKHEEWMLKQKVFEFKGISREYADGVDKNESGLRSILSPGLCRTPNGLPHQMDRLKAIGNGQVPLCAATAWRILTER
jgi:DNA (cytosine-5)-methyltransferase 1